MKIVNINKLKFLLIKVFLIASIFTILFSFIPDDQWINMETKNIDEQTWFDHIFNRLYFVMTTFSTAGFGDIYPKSKYARFATMLLQLCVIIVVLDYISI